MFVRPIYESNEEINEDCNFLDWQLALDRSDALFDRVSEEFHTLLEAVDNRELVVEKVTIGANNKTATRRMGGGGGGLSEFFQKIIKFINGVYDKFIERLTSIFDDEEDWIKKNGSYIEESFRNDEIYKTLSITAIPYFDRGVQGRLDGKDGTITKAASPNDFRNMKMDEVYEKFYQVLFKIDRKDSKLAAKRWWACENDDKGGAIGAKEFTGSKAAEKIQAMYTYIQSYRSLVNKAKLDEEKFTKSLEDASKKLEALESYGLFNPSLYSVLEEVSLANNGLGDNISIVHENGDIVIEGTSIVIEAGALNNVNNNPGADTSGDDQSGSMDRRSEEREAEKNKGDAGTEIEIARCLKKVAEINANIMSARLSVLETVKDHYMTILKQVVEGVKKYKGIQEEDAANKQHNQNVLKDIEDAKIHRAKQKGIIGKTLGVAKIKVFG